MSKGQSVSVEKQPLSDDVVPTQSAPPPPQFKVGDQVEWTHVGGSRNTMSMTAVKGYIHEIKGDKARCRRGKKGKKDYWVSFKALGRVGDRRGTKPIRDFIEGMTGKSLDLAE